MTELSEPAGFKSVSTWLRFEGLAVLVLSLSLYGRSKSSWWLFALLLLTPDIAMTFYLINARAGSIAYNIVHSYVLPLCGVAIAGYIGKSSLLPFVWIWTTHIGMDRALGYGLKYPSSFRRTHLGTVGKTEKGS